MNFPRPKNDSGIGFVYCSDESRYTRDDLAGLLPEMRAMGASWLSLVSTTGNVPEFFLRELIDHDIEPILGLVWRTMELQDTGSLLSLLKKFSSYGLRYIYFYSDPNAASTWPVEAWSQPNLVERFADLLFPCLDRAVEVGLFPLFPPLTPGGDYWDLSFLGTLLEVTKNRGKGYLFDRSGIAIKNIAHNKPINWGKGGRRKWKDARPYSIPHGSEDHRGFYIFEWYDEVVRAKLGYSLPLISVQGGATFGAWEESGLPVLSEDAHAQVNQEIAKLLMEGEFPDYVFNNSFWLLSPGNSPESHRDAWFKGDGTELPVVELLTDMAQHTRVSSWDRPPVPKSTFEKKIIHHYLLFAETEKGISRADWDSALDYIERYRPTCGFSVDEAVAAEFVTIVGNTLGVSPHIERSIRAAGCKVERMSARNQRELKRLFKGLASNGKRFISY